MMTIKRILADAVVVIAHILHVCLVFCRHMVAGAAGEPSPNIPAVAHPDLRGRPDFKVNELANGSSSSFSRQEK